MASANLDAPAAGDMTFTGLYGQPICTPGRAAIQAGRAPGAALGEVRAARRGKTVVLVP